MSQEHASVAQSGGVAHALAASSTDTPSVDTRLPAPVRMRQAVRALPPPAPLAILEVDEAPRPLLLILPGLFALLLALAAVWAWQAELDIVATAPGRIVPSARVKLVQPLEPGVVRAILVREGTVVRAGEPVVELDPTEAIADRTRLERDRLNAVADAARLTALLTTVTAQSHTPTGIPALDADAPAPAPEWAPPEALPADITATQLRLLDSQWQRIASQRDAATRDIIKATAQFDINQAQQRKAEAVAAILRERVAIRETLAAQALLPRTQLLELRQSLTEQEHEIRVLRATENQISAEVTAARARRQQIDDDAREKLLTELGEKERALATLAQERRKVAQREARRTLSAPVDGMVVDLAVHTIGGVVREAETLMRIVPEREPLEIEAQLRPRDVGFIRPGQVVDVKMDAFPYTRYGTLRGRVLELPADASGTDPAQAIYKLRIGLDTYEIAAEGENRALAPGQTATVDIRTGQRRMIDFIFDPVLRYRAEAMRER